MRKCLPALAFAALVAVGTGTCSGAPKDLTILGSVAIPPKTASGEAIEELSGLAWDADQQLLYAVSDDGVLHHFRIKAGKSALMELEAVFSVSLLAAPESAGGRRPVNAEGLAAINSSNAIQADSELLVAFENGPAIVRFTPQGEYLGAFALPHPLSDPESYSEENSRLEAVAFDYRYGVLTAPEEALAGTLDELHTVFSTNGGSWQFRTFQPHRSNLKALEVLPDGGFLVLERTREAEGRESAAQLRYFHPDSCAEDALCAVTDLTKSPVSGLNDNFEGMTSISETDFIVVTDQKNKGGAKTRVVIFRLVEEP